MSTIIVLGDSHCNYFSINSKLIHHAPWIKEHSVDVEKIIGASITGLGKRESTLNVSSIVRERIVDQDFVVLGFGQVDIELGYYYRKVVKCLDINIDDFLSFLLFEYQKYINDLSLSQPVIIKGVNVSVIKQDAFAQSYISRIITENVTDIKVKEELVNKLPESISNYAARNMYNLKFNGLLKEMARRNGWYYFDINSEVSGFNPGKGPNDEFIPVGFDHHLVDSMQIRKIHLSKLYDVINNIRI